MKGLVVRRTLVALGMICMLAVPGVGQASICQFGGLTPGSYAIKLDLPNGSDYMTLGIGGRRATQALNDNDSWHLAEGIIVFNATTLVPYAWWLYTDGSTVPRVVVHSGNLQFERDILAPETAQRLEYASIPGGLPPGSYIAAAFGVGGGNGILGPNEWRVAVGVRGNHDCTNQASGELFDYDHTDFEGTQVYAPGVGHGQTLTLDVSMSRSFVVGLVSSATPLGTGESRLEYATPTGTGSSQGNIRPFVSRNGTYNFRLNYLGVRPVSKVAGFNFDI